MANVLSLGNICIDRILRYAREVPRWGTEVFFDEYEERLGGQGANFAVAMAKLDHTSTLWGSIGADGEGEKIRQELNQVPNLKCEWMRNENESTGLTDSVVRLDGERLFLSYLGHQRHFSTNLDRNRLLSLTREADLVHVSGYFMLPKLREELPALLKEIKSGDSLVSFDPGWDPEGFEGKIGSEINSLLSYVDFFEPNAMELTALTHVAQPIPAAEALSKEFKGVIALKQGANGASIFKNGSLLAQTISLKIKVADTTGAGDAFDAGFLSGVLRGDSFSKCAWAGICAASFTISKSGRAISRFPSPSELEELIRNDLN